MKKEDFLKYFGKQVRKIRNAKGISLREFELRGDINRQQLSKIENGKWNPTVFSLKKIAQQLDITLSELFQDITK
jgi:transcriptional regulator with XRE-family HTH domain